MRITQSMIQDTTLRNIEANQERVSQLQSQITSGSRITKPSDDPTGSSRALSFQESIDATDQYLANIDQATSWVNTTDSALSTVNEVLQRARELAVQAANGTLSSSDRSAIDAEVVQLQQHTLSVAQAKYGTSYLFAGTKTEQSGYVQAQPSTVAGAYQGNAQNVVREISPGVQMSVNVNAQTTFDPVFNALNMLEGGLSSGSQTAVQSSINALDTATTSVLSARAQVGAKANRLQMLSDRLNTAKVSLAGLLSQVKDTDMAAALTNFSMAQTVYQASLKAGAQALQPSLLDYLR